MKEFGESLTPFFNQS